MIVDVIIPVYHSDKKLLRLLQGLKEQTMRPRKILLLNTEEPPVFTNETLLQQLRELAHFTQEQEAFFLDTIPLFLLAIQKEVFDHGGTRRFGADQSDADFLLFMTQDAVPKDNLLIEKLLQSFETDQVAAAYARQIAKDSARKKEILIQAYNYPNKSRNKTLKDVKELGIKTYFCSDVCAMYKRSAYLEVGGFVQKTIFNEDMIMAHHLIHAGFAIAYQANAIVFHSHHYGFLKQLKRNFDLGVSHAEHPEVFSLVSSESEGLRFVKKMFLQLCSEKVYGQAVEFLLEAAFKYVGFFLGKHSGKLPKSVILKLTSNKMYWN